MTSAWVTSGRLAVPLTHRARNEHGSGFNDLESTLLEMTGAPRCAYITGRYRVRGPHATPRPVGRSLPLEALSVISVSQRLAHGGREAVWLGGGLVILGAMFWILAQSWPHSLAPSVHALLQMTSHL